MIVRRFLPGLLALAPTTAPAHTGIGPHGSPFVSGLAHPLLGADHMLAMVAVGIFAAMTGSRALWAYPLSFVAAMLAGGLLGFGGAALPLMEPAILASVVIFGAAIAFAVRPPLLLACGIIALFGLAHGYAHGLEGPALGGLGYAAGFVLTTAALHAAGIALGAGLSRSAEVRTLGGLTVAAGAILAVW